MMKGMKYAAILLVLGMCIPAMAGYIYVDATDHSMHPDALTSANMYYNPDGTGTVDASGTHTDTKPRFRNFENVYSFGSNFYEIHKDWGDLPMYIHIDTGAAGTYNIKLYGCYTGTWANQVSLDGGVTWSDDINAATIDAVDGIDGQGWVDAVTGLGSPITPDGLSRGNNIVGSITTTDGNIYIGIRTDIAGQRGWFDGLAYEPVPEPATMCLLGLGALVLCRKK